MFHIHFSDLLRIIELEYLAYTTSIYQMPLAALSTSGQVSVEQLRTIIANAKTMAAW